MDPHEMFSAMEARLEEIRVDQKARADLEDEAERGGAGRVQSGTTTFQRKVNANMEILAQEGEDGDDMYEKAVLMTLRENPGSGSERTQPPVDGAGGGGHGLNSVMILNLKKTRGMPVGYNWWD